MATSAIHFPKMSPFSKCSIYILAKQHIHGVYTVTCSDDAFILAKTYFQKVFSKQEATEWRSTGA